MRIPTTVTTPICKCKSSRKGFRIIHRFIQQTSTEPFWMPGPELGTNLKPTSSLSSRSSQSSSSAETQRAHQLAHRKGSPLAPGEDRSRLEEWAGFHTGKNILLEGMEETAGCGGKTLDEDPGGLGCSSGFVINSENPLSHYGP